MNSGFPRYLRTVTAVHLMLVAALLIGGGFTGLLRKKPDVIQPMEFLVNVAPEQEADIEPPPVPDLPEDIPIPEPPPPVVPEPPKPADIPNKTNSVKKVEKKIEKPPVKKPVKKPAPPKKKPIETSKKKIVRTTPNSPTWASSKNRLSDAEIRRRLALGATPSDRDVTPDEESRCKLRIYQVLYDAWSQPTAAEAGNQEVLAELTFRPDGTIVRRELVRKTGNAAMDESARQAINAVQRISGLSPSFLAQHATVTVSFRVELE